MAIVKKKILNTKYNHSFIQIMKKRLILIIEPRIIRFQKYLFTKSSDNCFYYNILYVAYLLSKLSFGNFVLESQYVR